MDQWLKNAPALVFVKDVSTWVVINTKCDPIMWIDDDAELAWFFARILDLNANEPTKLRVVNRQNAAVAQRPNVNTQRRERRPRTVLPVRIP